MRSTSHLKRFAAATLVGGIVTAGQLVAPVAADAAGCYGAAASPDLAVTLSVGATTSTATVTVADGVTADGTLKASTESVTHDLEFSDGGSETVPFATGGVGSHTVTATVSPSDDGCFAGDTVEVAYDAPEVLGQAASAEGGTTSGANRSDAVLGAEASGRSTSRGVLAPTGFDLGTQMLALLGLGLVGAGTTSLIVNRRRVRRS